MTVAASCLQRGQRATERVAAGAAELPHAPTCRHGDQAAGGPLVPGLADTGAAGHGSVAR